MFTILGVMKKPMLSISFCEFLFTYLAGNAVKKADTGNAVATIIDLQEEVGVFRVANKNWVCQKQERVCSNYKMCDNVYSF